jgi:hypothetical protein
MSAQKMRKLVAKLRDANAEKYITLRMRFGMSFAQLSPFHLRNHHPFVCEKRRCGGLCQMHCLSSSYMTIVLAVETSFYIFHVDRPRRTQIAV